MGNVQDSPVSTNMISNERMITIRKKIHMVDCNFRSQNFFKFQNSYFAYFKQRIRKWL